MGSKEMVPYREMDLVMIRPIDTDLVPDLGRKESAALFARSQHLSELIVGYERRMRRRDRLAQWSTFFFGSLALFPSCGLYLACAIAYGLSLLAAYMVELLQDLEGGLRELRAEKAATSERFLNLLRSQPPEYKEASALLHEVVGFNARLVGLAPHDFARCQAELIAERERLMDEIHCLQVRIDTSRDCPPLPDGQRRHPH